MFNSLVTFYLCPTTSDYVAMFCYAKLFCALLFQPSFFQQPVFLSFTLILNFSDSNQFSMSLGSSKQLISFISKIYIHIPALDIQLRRTNSFHVRIDTVPFESSFIQTMPKFCWITTKNLLRVLPKPSALAREYSVRFNSRKKKAKIRSDAISGWERLRTKWNVKITYARGNAF